MNSRKKWIIKGFEHFAIYGPDSLCTKQIAEEIGVSRTTFYHYFADNEDFLNSIFDYYFEILDEHVDYIEKNCRKFIPDVYDSLARFKLGFKFTRQLFLLRANPVYNHIFQTYIQKTSRVFLPLFAECCNIHVSSFLLNRLWETYRDVWYSRIDENNITSAAMQKIAKEILQTLIDFKRYDVTTKDVGLVHLAY